MGSRVAREGDRVVGLDNHIVVVSQVPVVVPSPFTGELSGKLSSTVFIDGKAVALVGSTADNKPQHIPVGGSFMNSPANKGTVSDGSSVMFVDGVAVARDGDPVECCNDPADQDTGHVMVGSGTVYAG